MDEKIPFCYFGSHRDTGADPRGGGTSAWNESTRIDEVTSYPAFGDWGRMMQYC